MSSNLNNNIFSEDIKKHNITYCDTDKFKFFSC